MKLTRIEEQAIRLAGLEIKRDGVLGTDDGLSSRVAQVVRKELCAPEHRFGRGFVCKETTLRLEGWSLVVRAGFKRIQTYTTKMYCTPTKFIGCRVWSLLIYATRC